MEAKTKLEQSYMSPSAMTPTLSHDDFGLNDALSEIDTLSKKQGLDSAVVAAKKAAIARKYEGNSENVEKTVSEARENLAAERGNLSWYQFRRKLSAWKAKRDLDNPPEYKNGDYFMQKANSSNNLISLGYNYARARFAPTENSVSEHYETKLNSITKKMEQASQTNWLSLNFWEKAKLETSILFSRSPESIIKSMVKNGTIGDIEAFESTFKSEAESFRGKKGVTKRENKYIERMNKAFEYLGKTAEDGKEALKTKAETEQGKVTQRKTPEITDVENRYMEKLGDFIANTNNLISNEVKANNLYQVCMLAGMEDVDIPNVSEAEMFNLVAERLGNDAEKAKKQFKNYFIRKSKLGLTNKGEPIQKGDQRFRYDSETNYYNLQTVDEKGYPRTPSKDEVEKMLKLMKDRGVTEIEIDKGMSDEIRKMFEGAAKKAGMTIIETPSNPEQPKVEEGQEEVEVKVKGQGQEPEYVEQQPGQQPEVKVEEGQEEVKGQGQGQEEVVEGKGKEEVKRQENEEQPTAQPTTDEISNKNLTPEQPEADDATKVDVDQKINAILVNIINKGGNNKKAQIDALNKVLNAENVAGGEENGNAHAKILEEIKDAGFKEEDAKFLSQYLCDRAIAQEIEQMNIEDAKTAQDNGNTTQKQPFDDNQRKELMKDNMSDQISQETLSSVENMSKLEEYAQQSDEDWKETSKTLSPAMRKAVEGFRTINKDVKDDGQRANAKNEIVKKLVQYKYESKQGSPNKERTNRFVNDISEIVANKGNSNG